MRIIQGYNILSQSYMDEYARELLNYYKREDLLLLSRERTSDEMEAGKVYIGSSSSSILFPKCLPKERVEFVKEEGAYHDASRIRWKKKNEGEHCVVFRYQGQAIWQGIWFMDSKTLLFASADLLLIKNVLSWLEFKGYISRIPPKVQEGSHCVEVHEGIPRIVFIPKHTIQCIVGCDPEFEVIKNGGFVYPPQRWRNTDMEIGVDGGGQQIELRPRPGTPESVCKEISSLFKRLNEPVSVIGNYAPLGGHIHIGIGHRANPSSDLLFLLDFFLGKPTIDLSGTARRHYKKFSAYECKNWGFEYRTPPAAIFANPDIARLAMKIAVNVTQAYVNGQTIEINDTPQMEDYCNYCNFTSEEYNQWINEISTYKILMNRDDVYGFNFASLWNPKVPETTAHGSQVCPNTSGDRRCSNNECPICYPDTWRERRDMRIAEERREEERQERRRQRAMNEEREHILNLGSSIRTVRRRHVEINNELANAFNIMFNDDWDDTVMNNVFSILRDINFSSFGRPVSFFGLRRERGFVTYGFDIEGAERISERDFDRSYNYGFPHSVRTDPDQIDVLRQCLISITTNFIIPNNETSIEVSVDEMQEV